MSDPLEAVSPLDGRYRRRTEPLAAHVSESALHRARVQVEIEYVIALSDLDDIPFSLSEDERENLRSIYSTFDLEDAHLVKEIETTGYASYPATNHDVKAVEYFIREQLPEHLAIAEWIHFGLTSEDVNNLAYRILVKEAIVGVMRPAIKSVQTTLSEIADRYRDLPMLARTHGQPATPTTFGKEMAVFADRLARGMNRLDRATNELSGKLGGASGTYAAHHVAYPDVDWSAFSATFVHSLGFTHIPLTTQVNPGDDLAALFDALRAINRICIDLDRDMWQYVSLRYLGQAAAESETGSSTMPHKVNPIDFENSEGNLAKANADLVFLGDYITTSRLQRDLSDSTVKRNIGSAFAYALIGYEKTADGLGTISPNAAVMEADLVDHPEVVGEAIQTLLRRDGHEDAYERVKEATRGSAVTLEMLQEILLDLNVDSIAPERLTPEGYTGVASDLVDAIDDPE